jgi:hypothetical protein
VKIKFDNNSYRTVTSLLIASYFYLEDIISLVQYELLLKIEVYHPLIVTDVLFQYKIVKDKENKIKKNIPQPDKKNYTIIYI